MRDHFKYRENTSASASHDAEASQPQANPPLHEPTETQYQEALVHKIKALQKDLIPALQEEREEYTPSDHDEGDVLDNNFSMREDENMKDMRDMAEMKDIDEVVKQMFRDAFAEYKKTYTNTPVKVQLYDPVDSKTGEFKRVLWLTPPEGWRKSPQVEQVVERVTNLLQSVDDEEVQSDHIVPKLQGTEWTKEFEVWNSAFKKVTAKVVLNDKPMGTVAVVRDSATKAYLTLKSTVNDHGTNAKKPSKTNSGPNKIEAQTKHTHVATKRTPNASRITAVTRSSSAAAASPKKTFSTKTPQPYAKKPLEGNTTRFTTHIKNTAPKSTGVSERSPGARISPPRKNSAIRDDAAEGVFTPENSDSGASEQKKKPGRPKSKGNAIENPPPPEVEQKLQDNKRQRPDEELQKKPRNVEHATNLPTKKPGEGKKAKVEDDSASCVAPATAPAREPTPASQAEKAGKPDSFSTYTNLLQLLGKPSQNKAPVKGTEALTSASASHDAEASQPQANPPLHEPTETQYQEALVHKIRALQKALIPALQEGREEYTPSDHHEGDVLDNNFAMREDENMKDMTDMNDIDEVVKQAVRDAFAELEETYEGKPVRNLGYVKWKSGTKELEHVLHIFPPKKYQSPLLAKEFVKRVITLLQSKNPKNEKVSAKRVYKDHIIPKLPNEEKEWTKEFKDENNSAYKKVTVKVTLEGNHIPMGTVAVALKSAPFAYLNLNDTIKDIGNEAKTASKTVIGPSQVETPSKQPKQVAIKRSPKKPKTTVYPPHASRIPAVDSTGSGNTAPPKKKSDGKKPQAPAKKSVGGYKPQTAPTAPKSVGGSPPTPIARISPPRKNSANFLLDGSGEGVFTPENSQSGSSEQNKRPGGPTNTKANATAKSLVIKVKVPKKSLDGSEADALRSSLQSYKDRQWSKMEKEFTNSKRQRSEEERQETPASVEPVTNLPAENPGEAKQAKQAKVTDESASCVAPAAAPAREPTPAPQAEKTGKPDSFSTYTNLLQLLGQTGQDIALIQQAQALMQEGEALDREAQAEEERARIARAEDEKLQAEADEIDPELEAAEEKLAEEQQTAIQIFLENMGKDIEAKKRVVETKKREREEAEKLTLERVRHVTSKKEKLVQARQGVETIKAFKR